MRSLEGVFTAIITPFIKGEIDWVSMKKLLRFQLDGGIQGLVVCGTTGESPTLSIVEKQKLFEFIRSEVAGAIPLVMGTGSNSTAETIHATRLAKSWGADAALVVVPYYNKPSQMGLQLHFEKVASESGLPIILYNVPSRTITRLELETIKELSKNNRIVAIKEASGDLAFGRSIAESTGLVLSSGDDGTCLRLAACGGLGVISVISHLIPRDLVRLMKQAVAASPKGEAAVDAVASEFDTRFGELNSSLYLEANPIPLKFALWKMGLIESPELRLPLTTLGLAHQPAIDRALRSVNLMSGAGIV